MTNDELLVLLTNKLNSLNSAIGSAMQAGNLDAIHELEGERAKVELSIVELQAQGGAPS